ncbi:hypothetical protein X943_000587 [Babesia divergens]|uniref:CPW-WPC domain-containing protein n=1 Tax=Babesia divergens TaxID=32595 RepID=A0AAD9GCW4_BABDI|nr:hypothetical protein X943_000587 [Babesia divergens]
MCRWAMSHIYARVCDAPISYHGPCATSLPSVDTTEDKKHLEEICNIKWPCYVDSAPNYDAACPKFWYSDNGVCMPSAAYHGRCTEPVDLTKMHESERVLWGNRCGVIWPPKTSCNKNYYTQCPEVRCTHYCKMYSHCNAGNGRCKAPDSYTGPCFDVADLSFFSNEQKVRMGTKRQTPHLCTARV